MLSEQRVFKYYLSIFRLYFCYRNFVLNVLETLFFFKLQLIIIISPAIEITMLLYTNFIISIGKSIKVEYCFL